MTAYEIAQTYIGQKEVAGTDYNEKIINMLQSISETAKSDEIPWCSAFVNYISKQINGELSNSLAARSWLKKGYKVLLSDAICGNDIVVLKSPSNPTDENHGHVGFYHSHTESKIKLLGGNQDDSVCLKEYNLNLLLDIRRIKDNDLLINQTTSLENFDLDIKTFLKYGDRNTEVLKLQKRLREFGYYHSTIDGIFGKITLKAVEDFQKSRNLSVDGDVGLQTLTALNQISISVNEDWSNKAAKLIAFYETSSKNPWTAVTGDFDDQGISLGIFQWNIGQGSLQPFIKHIGKDIILSKMPTYGNLLWSICNTNINNGLQIIRNNFLKPNKKVKDDVKFELITLLNTDESINYQKSQTNKRAMLSKQYASKWAMDSRNSVVCTLEEFLFFYDLYILNGGLKGLTLEDVLNFKNQFPDNLVIQNYILDWFKNYPKEIFDYGEKVKTIWHSTITQNYELWYNTTLNESNVLLLILAYLRALRSRKAFILLTFIRKASIVYEKGYVNGEEINIDNF